MAYDEGLAQRIREQLGSSCAAIRQDTTKRSLAHWIDFATGYVDTLPPKGGKAK